MLISGGRSGLQMQPEKKACFLSWAEPMGSDQRKSMLSFWGWQRVGEKACFLSTIPPRRAPPGSRLGEKACLFLASCGWRGAELRGLRFLPSLSASPLPGGPPESGSSSALSYTRREILQGEKACFPWGRTSGSNG
jgi:hypothetical protein